MEFTSDFELNMGPLTIYELATQKDDSFTKKFVPFALEVLAVHSKYLTSIDLLERKEFEGLCIEEILEQYPSIQFAGFIKNPSNEDNEIEIYIDLLNDFIVQRDHIFYDRFFAYQLRQINLLRLDSFLDYQLEKHHNNNFQAFARFLHLVIRKHKTNIISDDRALTIHEWIVNTEKKIQQELEQSRDPLKIKTRGQIKRSEKDNITVLNRDQTVLLLYFLREGRVFLKDEYLNAADAGKAFHILTGYSFNTLRQELGKCFRFTSRENVEKIRGVLMQILNSMELKIRGANS